jgi:hypothetical protein
MKGYIRVFDASSYKHFIVVIKTNTLIPVEPPTNEKFACYTSPCFKILKIMDEDDYTSKRNDVWHDNVFYFKIGEIQKYIHIQIHKSLKPLRMMAQYGLYFRYHPKKKISSKGWAKIFHPNGKVYHYIKYQNEQLLLEKIVCKHYEIVRNFKKNYTILRIVNNGEYRFQGVVHFEFDMILERENQNNNKNISPTMIYMKRYIRNYKAVDSKCYKDGRIVERHTYKKGLSFNLINNIVYIYNPTTNKHSHNIQTLYKLPGNLVVNKTSVF